MRIVRGAVAGLGATTIDWFSLMALVEWCALAPTVANVPSLLLGALAQFLSCRYWVFEAQSGRIDRQLGGFILVEGVTLALNAMVFHFSVSFFSLHYLGARLLSSFLVYLFFSFPSWRRVFQEPKVS